MVQQDRTVFVCCEVHLSDGFRLADPKRISIALRWEPHHAFIRLYEYDYVQSVSLLCGVILLKISVRFFMLSGIYFFLIVAWN